MEVHAEQVPLKQEEDVSMADCFGSDEEAPAPAPARSQSRSRAASHVRPEDEADAVFSTPNRAPSHVSASRAGSVARSEAKASTIGKTTANKSPAEQVKERFIIPGKVSKERGALQLRACFGCKFVLDMSQFQLRGCPNCDRDFMEHTTDSNGNEVVVRDQELLEKCTTKDFHGLLSICEWTPPEDKNFRPKSWVARYHNIPAHYMRGCYAVHLPESKQWEPKGDYEGSYNFFPDASMQPTKSNKGRRTRAPVRSRPSQSPAPSRAPSVASRASKIVPPVIQKTAADEQEGDLDWNVFNQAGGSDDLDL